MVATSTLCLAVLAAAAAVFVVSAVVYMGLPYHRGDHRQLPAEEAVAAAVRAAGVTPGLYRFPYCSHKDMRSEAYLAMLKLGPVATLTVWPSGPPNMGKSLGQWFLYCIAVCAGVGLLLQRTIWPGAAHHHVVHVALLAAFLPFGLAPASNGIWKGQPWSVTLKEVFDGLLYAAAAALTFAVLWPR